MISTAQYRNCCLFILLFTFLGRASAGETALQNSTGVHHHASSELDDGPVADHHRDEVPERYPIAELNWHHVETPYLISLFVLFASYAKIAFHLTDRLAKIFPESCLLILLGLVVGVVIFFAAKDHIGINYTLDSDTFFLFLLPPIVLEAGYFMPNRSFFDNIGTILLYAVVGTLFNCFCIGASLFGIVSLGWVSVPMDFLDCLVFSSLISAVDPVAVLAVFEEVHVNEVLYILVFGESLLNDAVTVVLYRMFKQFTAMGVDNIESVDYMLGLTSFLVISVGGTAIGMIWGLLTAFVTKFTDHVRVIEPLFVFIMSYLSYLTAEVFGFSGIMAIVFCGIIMKKYVEANISQKSHTTIKYFMKMLSSISETIIFMFLGLSAVRDDHVWDPAFILCTLFFCLLYRAIGVILLTSFANSFRAVKVNKVEQFIMAYGGLRGAIAFSLAILLEAPTPELKAKKDLMETTCLIVVFFTVFIQGMTIKPLVDKLKVKRSNKHKPSMGEKIFTRLLDHAMAGIEDVIGSHGHNYWRDKWEEIDRKYLQPFLLREQPESKDTQILQVYTNLSIKDAMDYVKTSGSFNLPVYPNSASMSNFLRRNASSSGFGNGATSSIPHGVSDICLDMHSVGGAGESAARDIDDAELHHLEETVLKSMHQPSRQGRYKRIKHLMQEQDVENNENLLHRSVHLHLRHAIKQRRKKAKLAKRLGHNNNASSQVTNTIFENGVEKITVPELKRRQANGRKRHASTGDEIREGPVEVIVHPPEATASGSDDEGGITFEAHPDPSKHTLSLPEPFQVFFDTLFLDSPLIMEKAMLETIPERETLSLLGASPASVTMETPSEPELLDELDSIEPTAAESWLPWKQYSDTPILSERAKEESVGIFDIPDEVLDDSTKECDDIKFEGILRERRRSSLQSADLANFAARRGSGDKDSGKPVNIGGDVIRKLLLRRQSEVTPPAYHFDLVPPSSTTERRASDTKPYRYHSVPQDDDIPEISAGCCSPQLSRRHHHNHHHHHHHSDNQPHHQHHHHHHHPWKDNRSMTLPADSPSQQQEDHILKPIAEKRNGSPPRDRTPSPKPVDEFRINISNESIDKESTV
ncbi:sodium/hydrogen exchanger 3-like [Glandiceps talaboti]